MISIKNWKDLESYVVPPSVDKSFPDFSRKPVGTAMESSCLTAGTDKTV